MSNDQQPEDGRPNGTSRRRVLTYGALATLGLTGVAGAWYGTRPNGGPEPVSTATPTAEPNSEPTETASTDRSEAVPERVRRYAPDLYFGRLEKWFPTDPRPYVVDTEAGSVVDGFTALDDYSAAFEASGPTSPPSPTVFYNVVEAAPGVDAVQYWMYSVFDQFSVNFHWHDWELLQVFVDRESDAPLLLAASAHARKVPNNEYLEPDLAGERRPGVLAEVGSHSSASELNTRTPSFERLSVAGLTPDVTNGPLDVAAQVSTPFAYGLPRDEGARLPFVMPELDGQALSDHPDLTVDANAFVDASVTIGNWHGLPTPPTELPLRERGLVLTHPDSPVEADATYDLLPIAEIREGIDDFVGPQLRFEFAVPGFVEDLAADHLTSVGIPWTQPRFTDPLADVTDPAHHEAIDGTRPETLTNRVVGRVRQLQTGAGGALDAVSDEARAALEDSAPVSLVAPPVELVTRLASPDPVATVTRGGSFGFLHVEAGEHLLVVNGPGYAPLAERFEHDGGLYRAGASGDLTVIANEDAGWIRGDGRSTGGIERVKVSEEFAGVVYEGRPQQEDRFAVAVHRDGEYTVEVTDSRGRFGAFTVSPDDFGDDDEVVVDAVRTGKAGLIETLHNELSILLELSRALAERDQARGRVVEQLSAAVEAADAARTSAEREDLESTDRWLSECQNDLEAAVETLRSEEQDGYSDASIAALDPRIRAALDRAVTAIDADLA